MKVYIIISIIIFYGNLIAQIQLFPFSEICDFIYLSPNGLLFLGSTEGLYIHDGSSSGDCSNNNSLEKIDLHNLGEVNVQSSFFPDGNNNLWFCTYDKIVRLNLLDYSYSSYQLVSAENDTIRSDYYIFKIDTVNSILYAMANKELYQFNYLTFKTAKLNSAVDGRRILVVQEFDTIKLLSFYYTSAPAILTLPSSGKAIVSNTKWKNWPVGAYANDIVQIERNGVVIASTKGLFYGDMNSLVITRIQSENLDTHSIKSITRYDANTILVSTKYKGIYKLETRTMLYNPQVEKLRYYGLPDMANKMYTATDGTIFMSKYNDKIYHFHPERIKFKNLYYGEPDNDIFFQKFFSKVINYDLKSQSILRAPVISASNHNMIVSSTTPFKFSKIDLGDNKENLLEHPEDTSLYGLFKDINNDIYGSFLNGKVYRFSASGANMVTTPNTGQKGFNFFYGIDSTYFVGSVNNEKIVIWNPLDTLELLINIKFTGNIYNAVYVKELDVIALSSTAGLCLLNIKTNEIKVIDPTNNCYCVLSDNSNQIWYSTPFDIVKYNPVTSESITYNYSAGASPFKYQTGNCKQISNDSLMFFHDGGATLVSPFRIKPMNTESKILITDFKINDQDYHIPQVLNYVNEFSTTYVNNTISFGLKNIDWSDAKASSLKYMLSGLDQNWVFIDNHNQTIRYSGIPPGNYTLKIIGKNSDDVWNTEPKAIDITIKPPFWQTRWFILLSVFAGVAFIYWLVKSHYQRKLLKKNQLLREQSLIIEKQQAVENERTRIASEMHDDLGSGLTTIRYLSDKALQQAKDPEEANQIKRIADHSNTLVRNMSEIIWAMNSRFDNTENLTGYLRRYASEYLDERKISFTFKAEEENITAAIGGEKRRNIFLVFKELLHNTIKYSGARSVLITIETGQNFVITISEVGGKGFNPEESIEKGNGLFNCRKRLKSIDGSLAFEKTGEAMNIIISVPINSPTLA